MICKKCGANIPDTAKFCPKCGAKVEIAKVEGAKICPKCGASYPITAKFCRNDGTPLEEAPIPATEIKEPEAPEEEIKPEPSVEPELVAATEVEADEKPPEKEPIIEPSVPSGVTPPEKTAQSEKLKKVILCPKCGIENSPSAKFCKKCGDPLKERIGPPITAEGEIKPGEAATSKSWVAPGKTGTKNAKKHSTMRIWVGVCGLIIILAGVGSYFYFSGRIIKKPTEVTKVTKPTETPKPTVNIAGVEKDLNRALENQGLNKIRAEVDKDLTATLKGKVNDPRDKKLALHIAKSFGGIKNVMDNIVVEMNPPSPPLEQHARVLQEEQKKATSVLPSQTTRPAVNIAAIERRLNKSLRGKGLNTVYAKVNKDLTANLKGTVNDPRDKRLALSIADSFKEIKDVRDNILIAEKSPPPAPVRPAPPHTPKARASYTAPISKSPVKLEEEINSALRNAGLRGITAKVNNNFEVTLKGTVSGIYEKTKAFKIARRFKQVRRIRDMVFVVEQ